jgi:Cu-Zn family superoxide dismutase
VRRLIRVAVGGLAGCALVLGGTQIAIGSDKFRDVLTDLLTADGPFDSATARVTINEVEGSTTFSIRVAGIDVSAIDPTMTGQPMGAHLHTGPCVKGDFGDPLATPSTAPGAQAGPHYNHDVVALKKRFPTTGETPSDTVAEVSTKTEVWFDLLPNEDGIAFDRTTVPFVPVDPYPGDMSVVIHVLPTNPETGKAGDRQACLPLSVSGILPTE